MTAGKFHWVVALLLPVAGMPADAQTWYVDANSPSVPGTGTKADPFRAIQDGLNAAAPGETVLVGPGTYTGPGNTNLDFGAKDVELACQSGGVCVLDAQSSAGVFHFHGRETNLAVVRSFRILNGTGDPWGGGLLIEDSSPTFFNCVFERCTATLGGAVYIDGGSPRFQFCSFFRNHADDCGGGIYAQSASPQLTNCIFDQGTSTLDGGAMCLVSAQVEVSGTFFLRSVAGGNGAAVLLQSSTGVLEACSLVSNSSGGGGGGVRVEDESTVTVKHSQFTINDALEGGGLDCERSQLTLTNNLFAFNRADALGGGLHSLACAPLITNSTFVYNNAVAGGGAIFGRSADASIVNTISRRNTPQEFEFDEDSAPVVSHSNVEGGWDGDAIMDLDPLFGPGPSGSFYLWHVDAGQSEDSPIIDAGTPTPKTTELALLTTRRDNVPDANPVDIGFHYAPFFSNVTPNDTDRDDDVDLVDLQRLQTCFTGPVANTSAPLNSICGRLDFDSNLTVELDDFAEFLHDMTGP